MAKLVKKVNLFEQAVFVGFIFWLIIFSHFDHRQSPSLVDKRIIIVGSTSKMAAEVTYVFASLKAKLLLVDTDVQQLQKVAEKCRKINPQAEVGTLIRDVTSSQQRRDVINQLGLQFRQLDLLVFDLGEKYTTSQSESRSLIRQSCLEVTSACWQLLEQKNGSVVLLSDDGQSDEVYVELQKEAVRKEKNAVSISYMKFARKNIVTDEMAAKMLVWKVLKGDKLAEITFADMLWANYVKFFIVTDEM